jgi:hypothetical protein
MRLVTCEYCLAVLLLLFLVHVQLYKASRPLNEGELLNKEPWLQSLPKGYVPPSTVSGCTNIPGSSGPGCPIHGPDANIEGHH